MPPLAERTEEIYSQLTNGKSLGFEDRLLLKAIEQALEERLAQTSNIISLSPQQMDVINRQVVIGNLGAPGQPIFSDLDDNKPPDDE